MKLQNPASAGFLIASEGPKVAENCPLAQPTERLLTRKQTLKLGEAAAISNPKPTLKL